MSVTFELPAELERNLRAEVKDLDDLAREATLVGLYRQGRITHRDLSRALGTTRLETEAVLKRHNVTEDLPTEDDHQRALERLRGRNA
jgi:hypothetical protein